MFEILLLKKKKIERTLLVLEHTLLGEVLFPRNQKSYNSDVDTKRNSAFCYKKKQTNE